MQLSVRQKEILTGLFGIVVFFGGFVSAELAFRLVQVGRFGFVGTIGDEAVEQQRPAKAAKKRQADKPPAAPVRREGFFVDEETELRRPYPGQTMGRVRINNLGFRGPDLPASKPVGTLRVAFLGSSTTYDAEVREGENWPEVAAKVLQGGLDGCKVDFINAGLPGYSTQHARKYWQSAVRDFDVDVVVALPGDMTTDLQVAAARAGYNKGQHIHQSWLARRSLLWEKIEKNAAIVRSQRSAFSSEGKFAPDLAALSDKFSTRLQDLLDALAKDPVYVAVPTISSHVRREMDRAAQVRAAGSALFYMPYVSIPTLLDAQDAYNVAIRAVVGRSGVQLIGDEDTIPADETHFVDSRHFAPRGSAVMGRRVGQALLGSPGFREFLQAHAPACKVRS